MIHIYEPGDLCHCGHYFKDHKLTTTNPEEMLNEDEEYRACTIKGCKCLQFTEMDSEDLDFLKILEERSK